MSKRTHYGMASLLLVVAPTVAALLVCFQRFGADATDALYAALLMLGPFFGLLAAVLAAKGLRRRESPMIVPVAGLALALALLLVSVGFWIEMVWFFEGFSGGLWQD